MLCKFASLQKPAFTPTPHKILTLLLIIIKQSVLFWRSNGKYYSYLLVPSRTTESGLSESKRGSPDGGTHRCFWAIGCSQVLTSSQVLGEIQTYTRLSPPSHSASTLVSGRQPVHVHWACVSLEHYLKGGRRSWIRAARAPRDQTYGTPAPKGCVCPQQHDSTEVLCQPWGALSEAGGRAVYQPHSSQPGGSSFHPPFSQKLLWHNTSLLRIWALAPFSCSLTLQGARLQAVDLHQVR